jgi:endonuclease YncB( thermonuclease family)
MRSPRTRLPLLFVLLLLIAFPNSSHTTIRTVEGIVQKVSDGETLTLITRDGTKLRVRIYGIDAPEMRHEQKPGQLYGDEAKRALAEKVFRKGVTLTIKERDQYQCVVGIVKIGNRNINEEMVKDGWAWAYRQHLRGPYVSEFIDAERET